MHTITQLAYGWAVAPQQATGLGALPQQHAPPTQCHKQWPSPPCVCMQRGPFTMSEEGKGPSQRCRSTMPYMTWWVSGWDGMTGRRDFCGLAETCRTCWLLPSSPHPFMCGGKCLDRWPTLHLFKTRIMQVYASVTVVHQRPSTPGLGVWWHKAQHNTGAHNVVTDRVSCTVTTCSPVLPRPGVV